MSRDFRKKQTGFLQNHAKKGCLFKKTLAKYLVRVYSVEKDTPLGYMAKAERKTYDGTI